MGRAVIDKTGIKVGKLTVLRKLRTEPAPNGAVWLCKCDCGNEVEIYGRDLNVRSGNSGFRKSCGCMARGKGNSRKYKGYSPVHVEILGNCKRKIVPNGEKCELTLEDVKNIVSQDCFYCGESPSNKRGKEYNLLSHGIDRMDSEKGYTLENSVACCIMCNRMKMAFGVGEFLAKVSQIAEKWKD